MNLDPTPTQELLRETVRDYLERELPYDRTRELEREGALDALLWKGIAEQGWLGLGVCEARGGTGGALLDVGILVEELARKAAIVPVLEGIVALRLLERFAPPEVADALVAQVLAGSGVAVPALCDETGSPDRPALAAAAGLLDGEKAFVDYGQCASHHLVSARDGQDAGVFLVDAREDGVACTPLRSIGRTPLAAVRYSGATGQRLCGPEGLADLLRAGRALAALQCVGSMAQALEMTVAYATVRKQFGAAIGSFQAVRHHCANMAMRVASARQLAYEALAALDGGWPDAAVRVATAKASASAAAPEVLMLAHQIHGGNGVIEENDLYFTTLRGKDRSLAWGSTDECLADLAPGVEAPATFL